MSIPLVPPVPDADAILLRLRWPDGVRCRFGCGGAVLWPIAGRRLAFECAHCRRRTTLTADTWLHRSHLSPATWLAATALMATTAERGEESCAAYERALNLPHRTAWRLRETLAEALGALVARPLAGQVAIARARLDQGWEVLVAQAVGDPTALNFRIEPLPPGGDPDAVAAQVCAMTVSDAVILCPQKFDGSRWPEIAAALVARGARVGGWTRGFDDPLVDPVVAGLHRWKPTAGQRRRWADYQCLRLGRATAEERQAVMLRHLVSPRR